MRIWVVLLVSSAVIAPFGWRGFVCGIVGFVTCALFIYISNNDYED